MRRLVLLLGCIGVGGLIGTAGWVATGSQYGFLAITVCVAAAWLVVADPTRCMPSSEGNTGDKRGSDSVLAEPTQPDGPDSVVAAFPLQSAQAFEPMKQPP